MRNAVLGRGRGIRVVQRLEVWSPAPSSLRSGDDLTVDLRVNIAVTLEYVLFVCACFALHEPQHAFVITENERSVNRESLSALSTLREARSARGLSCTCVCVLYGCCSRKSRRLRKCHSERSVGSTVLYDLFVRFGGFGDATSRQEGGCRAPSSAVREMALHRERDN